jgi:hypothetical protein
MGKEGPLHSLKVRHHNIFLEQQDCKTCRTHESIARLKMFGDEFLVLAQEYPIVGKVSADASYATRLMRAASFIGNEVITNRVRASKELETVLLKGQLKVTFFTPTIRNIPLVKGISLTQFSLGEQGAKQELPRVIIKTNILMQSDGLCVDNGTWLAISAG